MRTKDKLEQLESRLTQEVHRRKQLEEELYAKGVVGRRNHYSPPAFYPAMELQRRGRRGNRKKLVSVRGLNEIVVLILKHLDLCYTPPRESTVKTPALLEPCPETEEEGDPNA